MKGHTISVCKQCTPPALKPNTYIQTLTEYSPHSTFDLFILTARGALTISRGCPLRGGSCDGLLPSWTLGNFTWQNARSALGVPISGPPHPTVAPVFATVAPDFSSTSSTYLIRWLPCATHGHVGTLPSSTLKPLALAHGSAASDLLAPSLQFASLSTYSNHAQPRALRAAADGRATSGARIETTRSKLRAICTALSLSVPSAQRGRATEACMRAGRLAARNAKASGRMAWPRAMLRPAAFLCFLRSLPLAVSLGLLNVG